MAEIAHARSFDGSDQITFDLGGNGGAPGAFSLASIIWKDAALAAAGCTVQMDDSFAQIPQVTGDSVYYYDLNTVNSLGNVACADDAWEVHIITKPTGTSTARIHRYRYTGTPGWTHSAIVSRPAVSAPIGTTMGVNEFSQFYIGLIAVAAYWKGVELSDGDCETLTDALDDWLALSPSSVWLLNQESEATPIEDLVGTSDQNAITGTTAVAVSDLPFDVGEDAGVSIAWITA
jgi:hypothetical protein